MRRFSECSIFLSAKKKRRRRRRKNEEKIYNSVINACTKDDSVILLVVLSSNVFFSFSIYVRLKLVLVFFYLKNKSKKKRMSLWNFYQTIPKRYLLSLLAFFGFFNAYILRSNLSIAIIPMVKSTLNASIAQPVKMKAIFCIV